MINVEELLLDPDFAQSYTVFRRSGYLDHGRYVLNPDIELLFFGPVMPSTAKEVSTIPEGDRVTGMMTFYSPVSSPFQLSYHNSEDSEGLSDQVLWRGDRYKLLQVFNYDDYGYQKAIGVRISGV